MIEPPFTPPAPAPGQITPPMVYVREPLRWEYRHVERPVDQPALSEADLNPLGAEGWELSGVYSDGSSAHFYFKRLAD